MRPDREPRRPDGGELLDEVAEVLGPVRDGAEGVVLRQRRERRRDLLLDLGCEQAERLGARLLGREVRVVVVGCERRVEAGGDLAEPPGALGQPGRVVAERPEGDLPASARGRDERGQRRERRLERRPLGGQGPLQPRGVGEAGRGERVEHLELGVRPCLEPAIELQHVELVEHDGAVRLLDAERANPGTLGRDPGERREPRGDLRPLEGVDHPVVGVQRDEIVLVRPRAEPDLDDRERHEVVLDGDADDLGVLRDAVLRREPPGPRHEREELVARQRPRVTHRSPPPGGGTRRTRGART